MRNQTNNSQDLTLIVITLAVLLKTVGIEDNPNPI